MTEPTIDLDAILSNYLRMMKEDTGYEYISAVTTEDAKKAMLQACKECLRVASEKARIELHPASYGGNERWEIKKDSILNVEKLIKL